MSNASLTTEAPVIEVGAVVMDETREIITVWDFSHTDDHNIFITYITTTHAYVNADGSYDRFGQSTRSELIAGMKLQYHAHLPVITVYEDDGSKDLCFCTDEKPDLGVIVKRHAWIAVQMDTYTMNYSFPPDEVSDVVYDTLVTRAYHGLGSSTFFPHLAPPETLQSPPSPAPIVEDDKRPIINVWHFDVRQDGIPHVSITSCYRNESGGPHEAISCSARSRLSTHTILQYQPHLPAIKVGSDHDGKFYFYTDHVNALGVKVWHNHISVQIEGKEEEELISTDHLRFGGSADNIAFRIMLHNAYPELKEGGSG